MERNVCLVKLGYSPKVGNVISCFFLPQFQVLNRKFKDLKKLSIDGGYDAFSFQGVLCLIKEASTYFNTFLDKKTYSTHPDHPINFYHLLSCVGTALNIADICRFCHGIMFSCVYETDEL